MQTDFIATGYMSLEGEPELNFPSITEFAADTSQPMEVSGIGVFRSIGQTSVVDITPTVLNLVASGSISLSSKSIFGVSSPTTASDDGTILQLVPSGSWQISGYSEIDTSSPAPCDFIADGGWEIGGSVSFDSPALITNLSGKLNYLVGAMPIAIIKSPLITHLVATGGYVLLSGTEDDDEVFEAWVLNGLAFEPSIFSGFNFNSFAQKGNQCFAAGRNGIYLLGGEDDDGEPIHTGARVGPINFGWDNDKRLRSIHMGNGGWETRIRVSTDGGELEGIFQPFDEENRVTISRDIQGREFVIDFQDFEELSHVEIAAIKLARR